MLGPIELIFDIVWLKRTMAEPGNIGKFPHRLQKEPAERAGGTKGGKKARENTVVVRIDKIDSHNLKTLWRKPP